MGTLTEIAGEPHTQGFTPGLGVDGKPKPYFANGTSVYYELAPGVNGYGFIRGLVSQHVIDIWIVERVNISDEDRAVYPWSCITVPHTCLKKVDKWTAGWIAE